MMAIIDAIFSHVLPLLAGIAALAACLGVGVLGWRRNCAKIADVWAKVVEREGTGTHPYRHPLRIMKVERLHGLVRTTIMVNGALWPCIVWFFLVCAFSMWTRDLWVALIAFVLGLISVVMVRNAHRFSVRGPEELPVIRGRIVRGAMVSLLGYGAIALTFIAMARGKLDGLDFDIEWLTSSFAMTRLPVLVSLGGHRPILWQPLSVVTMIATCIALIHAGFWLVAVLVVQERIAKSEPRFRVSLGAGLLVVLAGFVGVVVILEGMPARIERTAKEVYNWLSCSLPPLPESATEVDAKQRIGIMSAHAEVQFKMQDPTSYKRSLGESWYGHEKPSNALEILEPRTWREDVDHYSYVWLFGNDSSTNCEVFVDRDQGVIRIEMVDLH